MLTKRSTNAAAACVCRLYRGVASAAHIQHRLNSCLPNCDAAQDQDGEQRAHVWQAGHTARRFGSGRKKIAVPAEPLKKLDVDRPGIRAGDMIAIPLPNIGSMGGECWPLSEGAIAQKAVPSNLLQMGVSS